jgi:hypothetical protein
VDVNELKQDPCAVRLLRTRWREQRAAGPDLLQIETFTRRSADAQLAGRGADARVSLAYNEGLLRPGVVDAL